MSDNNNNVEFTVIEITPQTHEMVETEMAGESDEVKRETKALIEAIKRRAQAEARGAGTLSREAYLTAVRRARQAIEGNPLIEPQRVENAFETMQREAEKNLQTMMKEATHMGERFMVAAQIIWETFTAPSIRG